MAQLSKSALTSENNNSFPNNNTGYITPELLRTFNQDVIDSTVNQTVYTADSASWNSQIAALDPSGSAQSIVELNEFTASQNIKNTTLASVTASLQQQLTNIGSQSGSWVTESETGSFARTNVTNTFTEPQIISAAVTASAARIANLNYPTTDNGAKSFVQTDGNGNLSLQYVDAILEEVRYGENIRIGDPLYVSGSNGTRPIVWKADAAITAKMPVIYIATSTNVANTNTTAITLGNITGVTTTGYPVGTEIYVAEGGGWSANRPSGSSSIVQPLGIVTKEAAGGGGRGLVLNPGPATLPNIQTGYAWVGNSTNQPVAVATSSFGGGGGSTDITSLNAFTASQETKNTTLQGVTSSLQSYTASQNTINTNVGLSASIYETKFATIGTQSGSWAGGGTDITALNNFTASQETKNTTLASVTASLQQQLTNIGSQSGSWITESETGSFLVTASVTLNTITFTKGDTTTFNITVDTGSGGGGTTDLTSLNAFTASQELLNTTFATTGSNNFIGVESIGDVPGGSAGEVYLLGRSGSLVIGNSTATPTYAALSHISSSQVNANTNLIFKTSTTTADTIVSGSNNLFVNPAAATTGFKRYIGGSANIALNASNVPQISGSMQFSPTMNNNIFNGNSTATTMRGPVSSSAWTISANNLQGQMLIGTTAANHAQGIVAGLNMLSNVTNGNFGVIANKANLTQALNVSQNNIGGALTLTAASSSISWTGNTSQGTVTLTNTVSGSGATVVSSSNAVYAYQNIIGGQLTILASGAELSDDPTGVNFLRTFERNLITGNGNTVSLNSNTTGSHALASTAIIGNNLTITGSSASPTFNSGITNHGAAFFGRYNALDGNRAKSSETVFAIGTGTSTSNRKTGFLIDSGSNTFVEGTLNLSGSFNADLQQGYVWVGDASGRTTTVATSSFGGGGAAFPYTGDAVITGSLQVTGSFRGYVNSLSVASNTASINMNDGNFFTLNLPTSSTTHITITNIKAGQTINLQVSQSSASTGSVAFAPNIKFAGGFDYTASPITGALDLLSFVSFDTNQILATSVKNLL